ncbi:hypothetical protein NQ272_26810, partial [Escherichia coli]|nr:hypothetical protein [Escherichia coli]
IEDFLSKFKTIRHFLEGVKVKKADSALIYCILSKLGPAYSLQEKPSFLKDMTTSLLPLMLFVIL